MEDAEAVMGYLWRLSDWVSRVWRRVSAWGLKIAPSAWLLLLENFLFARDGCRIIK